MLAKFVATALKGFNKRGYSTSTPARLKERPGSREYDGASSINQEVGKCK